MKLSYRSLGGVVVLTLIVFSQMDGVEVEARRGAFLSTGGTFRVALSSNRGGNTEEDRLGETRGMEPEKEKKGKELTQKADEANKELLSFLDANGGGNGGQSGGPRGYESNGKDLADELDKALVKNFKEKSKLKELWLRALGGMPDMKVKKVTHEPMTSPQRGKKKDFIRLHVEGPPMMGKEGPPCTLAFGFSMNTCQSCCCPKGLVLAEMASDDLTTYVNEGGSELGEGIGQGPQSRMPVCPQWLAEAARIGNSFANTVINVKSKDKITKCQETILMGENCDPPSGLCSASGRGAGGNSELALDEAKLVHLNEE